jgi:hypothetical protein
MPPDEEDRALLVDRLVPMLEAIVGALPPPR